MMRRLPRRQHAMRDTLRCWRGDEMAIAIMSMRLCCHQFLRCGCAARRDRSTSSTDANQSKSHHACECHISFLRLFMTAAKHVCYRDSAARRISRICCATETSICVRECAMLWRVHPARRIEAAQQRSAQEEVGQNARCLGDVPRARSHHAGVDERYQILWCAGSAIFMSSTRQCAHASAKCTAAADAPRNMSAHSPRCSMIRAPLAACESAHDARFEARGADAVHAHSPPAAIRCPLCAAIPLNPWCMQCKDRGKS